MSKPSKEVQARYDAGHTRQIRLKLNLKTDADILQKLDSVENKQGYIKGLIRADIKEGECKSDFQKTLEKALENPEFRKAWEEDEEAYRRISERISQYTEGENEHTERVQDKSTHVTDAAGGSVGHQRRDDRSDRAGRRGESQHGAGVPLSLSAGRHDRRIDRHAVPDETDDEGGAVLK